MMNLDDELHRALSRTQPDPGLAERILGRVAAAEKPPRFADQRWYRIAAAAVLVLSVGIAIQVDHRRASGERARRDVMTALHIAGAKVRLAQTEVRKAMQ
jgi:hypothetical protein